LDRIVEWGNDDSEDIVDIGAVELAAGQVDEYYS
jgi:hypothetical protein